VVLSMMNLRRSNVLFVIIALVGAVVITRGLVSAPGYTDAYYYFNAAQRLAAGDGLTDTYLWTYIGAPDALPEDGAIPSHLYWMPLTSLIAAFGMWLAGTPGDYGAAQWPFTLLLAGTACAAYWLGGRIGGTDRHRWVAGLLALFSGFFTRFWGAVDTFAPYALIGALCLVFTGLALERGGWRWLAAGALAGLGHLTRADGLLLLLVGLVVILWPSAWMPAAEHERAAPSKRLLAVGLLLSGYLLVMAPWFIRNLEAIGTPLPVGGAHAIWFTEYNDLFNYPPGASVESFFADGPATLFQSRWEALINNLQTFIAVEGLVVMTPLMLAGLWLRRRDPFLRAFWLYALGLHLAMTLVFPYPGYRGGLFHSAAALAPWWAALGAAGLDDAVNWIARRRRSWRPRTAQVIFSAGLVTLAVFLSASTAVGGRVGEGTPALYRELATALPPDARVMINDPAALYYHTGLGGVVLPNATPEIIPEIARHYRVTHVLLQAVTEDGYALAATDGLANIPAAPPSFLTPISLDIPEVRLYAIDIR
jgi:hypothetical protein